VDNITALFSRLLHRLAPSPAPQPAGCGAAGHPNLAFRVDAKGIGSVTERELTSLARAGEAAGASRTVIDVMIDPSETRPARERALGLVQVRLEQSRGVGYHLAA
jgi:hypothetical protein